MARRRGRSSITTRPVPARSTPSISSTSSGSTSSARATPTRIVAGNGDDRLVGGAGNDKLFAGLGNGGLARRATIASHGASACSSPTRATRGRCST
ncbi:hypothetical protein AB5I41_09020 [Sphingomonas sp. MMS24-JH45]